MTRGGEYDMTGMTGALDITIAGQPATLLPSRALWLPTLDTLVVADLHWGKAAAFRAAHVPVPMGTTANDLARLSHALTSTQAKHLTILGDLLHARTGRHVETLRTIADWRAHHPQVRITLVRGNHDVRAGDPPSILRVLCVDPPHRLGPFVCTHEPAPSNEGYVLSGHLHPSVSMYGRGRQSVRLPAFVFGPGVGVLPAFSSFTGGGMYERNERDRLFVVADDVIALEG